MVVNITGRIRNRGRSKKMVDKKILEEEERCIGNLRNKFVKDPLLQHRVRFSASEVTGAITISWHRGIQKGQHKAYLAIKDKFPEAAKALLDSFGMDENGSIKL